tara:strand:+ start:36830 stop:37975 length:1146 start_codon:yes stop_codon:yes gene_type:complete
MRIAATAATLLFALTACSTTERAVSPYQQPNALMSTEINQRIDQIPYQHRDELVQNLLWLAQTGEQTIPALIAGLNSENPKVRSSCCWVLGRLRDRRTVPALQSLVRDSETSVRMEACRTLVLMGDLEQSPKLIEGLDSDRKEVRYMCHEALKTATGHDFGYDHLNQDQQELQFAVLRWRQWWGEYGGDTFFASSYEQEHGLNNLAAPGGETQAQSNSSSNGENGANPDSSIPATNTEEPMPSTTATENGNGKSEAQTQPPATVPGAKPAAVPPSIPPAVPPRKGKTVPVPEAGGQKSSAGSETGAAPETETSPATGTESGQAPSANTGSATGAESNPNTQNGQATKPAPVITVRPANGGNATGGNANGAGNSTGSESGGN